MKKVYFIYKNDKINSPHLYAITDKKELHCRICCYYGYEGEDTKGDNYRIKYY